MALTFDYVTTVGMLEKREAHAYFAPLGWGKKKKCARLPSDWTKLATLMSNA